MKKNLLFFLLLAPFFTNAQQTEDFSDGNFTSNPAWSGDAAQFIVNPNLQLQLSTSGAGTSYLSSANNLTSLDSVDWRCYVKQGFAPSSANYGRIYLASDQANLEGPLNGYYIQLGEALANDAVELFCQSGTISTSVCRGTNARIAASFAIGVRVTRNAAGFWSLYIDAAGGTNYLYEASGTNTTVNSSAFFGVVCTYTSGNAANFFFDNFFVGPLEPDLYPPVPLTAVVVGDSLLDLKFNEAVEQAAAETMANYTVNNGIGTPVSATRDASDIALVHLAFSSSFTGSVPYTINIDNLKDLGGNTIDTNTTILFYKPDMPSPTDLVINEVLFNARVGGAEFIEIYNNSQKVIDLKSMKITREDLATHVLDAPVTISTSGHFILPGEYIVLSDDFNDVKSQYATPNPNAFVNMNLPDLLTDEDIILVLDSNSVMIDQLHYYSSWHFPLLNDVDGVSLERLSPNGTTQDQSNWHSAAETAGFATPGYKNSEYLDTEGDGSEISVDPEIFSPDNDGHNDVVNVHYHFDNPGNVANVNVFDSKGRLIRNLVNNQLLGNDGIFAWDGVTNENGKARIGMYIFYIEVFDMKGDTKNFKKTCVLAGKL